MQIGQLFQRLAVRRGQQPADEIERPLPGPLGAGRRIEAAPKALGGPLFAGTEQRPTDAAFVVLGARQGQRRQHYVAFAGRRDRAFGPVGIACQLVPRDAVRRLAPAQMMQGADQLAGDLQQARIELGHLLIFGDVPAPGIVFGKQNLVERAVRFASQPRRGHELAVGGDRIFALALKPGVVRQQSFPAALGHDALARGWLGVLRRLASR